MQRVGRTAARSVRVLVVLAALAGLFAMHGLPAHADPGHGTTGAHAHLVAAAHGEVHVAPVPMAGCEAADHCAATLRAAEAPTHPPVVTTLAAGHPADRAVTVDVVTPDSGPDPPPGPDPLDLGISRT